MATRIGAVLCLLLVSLWLTPSMLCAADEPNPAAQSGHQIAVLDYDQLLQNSKRYKKELDKLKAGTAVTETELKKTYDQIHKLQEQLKTIVPSSPEFRKREEEITLKEHELQARIKIERKKFEEQRVQLEASILRDIDTITKQVAIAHNIALVLNVSTNRPPLNNQEEVTRLRQQNVVYFNPGIDLTQIVQNKLNEAFPEKPKAEKK